MRVAAGGGARHSMHVLERVPERSEEEEARGNGWLERESPMCGVACQWVVGI